MKRKIFKAIFIQSWGTFTNETLVCVGVTKLEILKYMKRAKVKPELIKRFEDKAHNDKAAAFVWTPPNTGCTLLWMGGFCGDDEDIFDIVHETNHLIYDISRDKGFRDEPEIQAYQQEFLFSHILKELRKRYKKFKGVKSKRSKR